MENKNILITGGAGFIGSHLAEDLTQNNQVTVIDNFSNPATTNPHKKIKTHRADITDKKTIKQIFTENSFDTIFHLASRTDVSKSTKNPKKEFKVTVTGTKNILEAAKNHGIEKLVFTSSASVYGNSNKKSTEKTLTQPKSPYAEFKLSAEQLGKKYQKKHDIPFTTARISNAYGPRQKSQVIHDLTKKLFRNPEKLEVLGTGNQVRNFCHVDDITKGLKLISEKAEPGQTYNLAGDNNIKIMDLAQKLCKIFPSNTEIQCTNKTWKGDIKKLKIDNSKIKEELGFKQNKKLEQGLKEYKKWYKKTQTKQKTTKTTS